MSAPTEARRKVLRFLLDHPGMGVFDYYDYIRGGSFGMERVAVRGAAGRMRYRLHAGLSTCHKVVCPGSGVGSANGAKSNLNSGSGLASGGEEPCLESRQAYDGCGAAQKSPEPSHGSHLLEGQQ